MHQSNGKGNARREKRKRSFRWERHLGAAYRLRDTTAAASRFAESWLNKFVSTRAGRSAAHPPCGLRRHLSELGGRLLASFLRVPCGLEQFKGFGIIARRFGRGPIAVRVLRFLHCARSKRTIAIRTVGLAPGRPTSRRANRPLVRRPSRLSAYHTIMITCSLVLLSR